MATPLPHPDHVLAELFRAHPEVKYASPLEDADLLNNLPAVTWRPSTWGSDVVASYQGDLGYSYPLTVQVHGKTYDDARRTAGEIWTTLRVASAANLPSVDGVRLTMVDLQDLPTEHRTFGQAFSYYSFSFFVTVTVDRAP